MNLEVLQSYCSALNTNPAEHGDFIDIKTAGNGHAEWLRNRYGTANPDELSATAVVAISIGINKLQALLDRSRQHNCVGWRFYFCRSIDTLGTAGNEREVEHDDIVIIPIRPDGIDLTVIRGEVRDPAPIRHPKINEQVENLSADPYILNTSKPCPNYCSHP